MLQVRSLIKLLNDCSPGKQGSSKSTQNLYKDLFEAKFIERTQQFYQKQQQRVSKQYKIEKYIQTVDLIFEQEDALMEKYFDNLSFSLNNSCIYEYMIKNCHDEILKSGLPSLLNERKYKEIVLLYSYMHDTDLLLQTKEAWAQYIYDRGIYYLKAIKPSRESILQVIGQIIDLKILTDTVLDECFQSNVSLRNAQIQSFQEFFNHQGQQAKMAQIVSLYIDCTMRADLTDIHRKQISELSDQTNYEQRTQQALVQLFRFLQAKDIFIQTYVEYLSDRLLRGLSKGGAEAELVFAAKFKQECGDTFAGQTEQMVNDITLRGELSEQYRRISKKIKNGQKYEFLILDSTKWPIKNANQDDEMTKPAFPKQIKDVYEEFTQMYEKSKRGKPVKNDTAGKNPQSKAIILTWNLNLGHCEIQTYTLSDPNRELFILKTTCI